MMIVQPDFARRIDLPGNGPCPRPVDIDRTTAELSHLVSLRVYAFAKGAAIDGEAEGDEVFVVLMRGQADIGIDSAGVHAGPFALRADAGPRVAYLPPHAAYRLRARTACDVAYARVSAGDEAYKPPRAFAASGDRFAVTDHAVGMTLQIQSFAAGSALAMVADDGGEPERFLHLRSDDDGIASIGGERLTDWMSVVLRMGERGVPTVERGTVEILTIAATAR